MKYLTRLPAGLLLAVALTWTGCGKKDEQPTRFNETLGDTPVGVPTGTVPIDTGILKDQAGYKPADYEPLEGFGGAGGGPQAGGPETEAIRTVLVNLVRDAVAFDIETVLDAFVPEQVALLRQDDYLSTFDETKTTIEQFQAALERKATGPEFESATDLQEMLPKLVEVLKNTISVTVLDRENAVLTVDLGRLELTDELRDELTGAMALGASMGQMGAPGGPAPGGPTPPPSDADTPDQMGTATEAPGGGMSLDALLQVLADVQYSLSFRKVDDQWRLVLPFTIEEEYAQLINDGFLLAKDIMADVTQRIDLAESVDLQTYMQILTEAQMRQIGAIVGWVGRAKLMIQSIMEAAAGEAGPTEQQAEEEEEEPAEPNAPQDANAPAEPPGPGRRGP